MSYILFEKGHNFSKKLIYLLLLFYLFFSLLVSLRAPKFSAEMFILKYLYNNKIIIPYYKKMKNEVLFQSHAVNQLYLLKKYIIN